MEPARPTQPLLRNLRGVVLALAGLLSIAVPAHAQTPTDPNLVAAFQARFDEVLDDMRERSQCVAQRDRYRLAFLGIAAGEPRLTANERSRINGAMRDALRDGDVPMTLSDAGNAGLLNTLTQTLGMGQAEFNNRLAQLAADFTILVAVERPAPEVALVKISIYGRPGGDARGCDDVLSMAVDLAAMTTTTPPVLGEEFYTFAGGIDVALQRNREMLDAASAVGWRVESRFPDGCAIADWALDAMFDAYFEAREMVARTRPGNAIQGTWPSLSRNPGPDALILAATLSASSSGAPGVALRLTVEQAGDIRDSRRLEVVVPRRQLRGCYDPIVQPVPEPDPVAEPEPDMQTGQTAPPAAETPAIEAPVHVSLPRLSIQGNRTLYQVGDTIDLTIVAPTDCQLTLINVDTSGKSCLMLPHPALPAATLRADQPYQFPPAPVRLRAAMAGTERFIALCDASPQAIAAEQPGGPPADCATSDQSPQAYERAMLDFVAAPEPETEAPRESAPAVLRGEIAIEIVAPALPEGLQAVPGRYVLPEGKCYVTLATTATAPEAQALIRRWMQDGAAGARIFQSQGGGYAAVMSTVAAGQADWILRQLLDRGRIPSGATCVNGQEFIAEVR